MKMLKILAAASAAIAAPSMAGTTVQFTNIKANWFDVVGGAAVGFTGQNTGNAGVFWGTGGQQSGYRYQSVAIPTLEVDPLTDTSAIVDIGTFTHYNFPINSGTAISAVKLKFTTDVIVNGSLFGTVNFIYAFNHFETGNGDVPCADGGSVGVGVNINGCADRVAVNFNQASGFFSLDGVDYALDVRGFLVNNSPTELFWTTEQATNTASLRGQIVLRTQAGVPEPASWAMMIGGLGIAGVAMRRRATRVQFA